MEKEIRITKYILGFLFILMGFTAIGTFFHKEKPLPTYKVVVSTYTEPHVFKEYPAIPAKDNHKPFVYVEPTDPGVDELIQAVEELDYLVEDMQ